MTDTYEKMFNEYQQAIVFQTNIIKERREELSKAHQNNNRKEIKRLNSLLLVLYDEKNELEERAVGLRQYISANFSA